MLQATRSTLFRKGSRAAGFTPIAQLVADGYHFQFPQTVAWGDLDQFQHVNNVAYARWFETARCEYFHHLNLSFKGDVKPIVAGFKCRYRRPMAWPEDAVLACKVVSFDVPTGQFVLRHCAWSVQQETIAAVGDIDAISYDFSKMERAAVPREWVTVMCENDKLELPQL